jgi:hypothetical protein
VTATAKKRRLAAEQVEAMPRIGRIHALLGVQSLVVILGSVNRLGSFTLAYVAANEFLRWVDLANMIILPLISMVAFYLLKKEIEYDSPRREARRHLVINIIFIIGIYLLGASYGDHEVTNYLHARFCADDTTSDLCRIIIFNDDEFSHWLFFAGFALVNGALLFLQVLFPYQQRLTRRDIALLLLNAFFIAAGIFANLALEEIGLDLYVVALLTGLSAMLFYRHRQQPLLLYYTAAYVIGLVATVVYRGAFAGNGL